MRRFTGRTIRLLGGLLGGGLVIGLVFAVRYGTVAPGEREVIRDVEGGQFVDAKGPLDRWLIARPDSAEAHYYKGRVALALGDLAGAVEALNRANALGLFQRERDLLGGLIASKLGQHKEAEPRLLRAYTELKRPDSQISEALARTYLESFDLNRAAAVIERWTHEFPNDAKPYLYRAEIHLRSPKKEPTALFDDYREAVERDPNLAEARLHFADELCKAHRNAEAAVEYDAYLKLEPESAAGYRGAGKNQVESGDEKAARRYFERSLQLDPRNSEVLRELAELSIRRGDFAGALSNLDKAISLDPMNVAARDRRVLTLFRLGRTDEARAEQDVAKRLKADNDRAGELLEKLVKSPHDRNLQIEAARWMFEHGRDAEGIRWAEKLLGEDVGNPEANLLLADYYQRRGNPGLANFYRLQGAGDAVKLPAKR